MMQCLVCEVRIPTRSTEVRSSPVDTDACPTALEQDWFHSSHLNLTPLPVSQIATDPVNFPSSVEAPEDTTSEPVLTEDDYSHIICERCVLAHPVLVDHLGSPGFLTLLKPAAPSDPTNVPDKRPTWEILGRSGSSIDGPAKKEDVAAATSIQEIDASTSKHGLPTEDTTEDAQPPSKRIRLEASEPLRSNNTCVLAPPPGHLASLVAARRAAVPSDHGFGTGRVDLFLPEDFRDKWCRCDQVRPSMT
jgi:E3 ubiquitin-protein ligase UBR7